MKRFVAALCVVVSAVTASNSFGALIFTLTPGTASRPTTPFSLFVRSDSADSLFSIDVESIQLSAGSFIETLPPTSPTSGSTVGSLFGGTLGGSNVLSQSVFASNLVTSPTNAFISISYANAQLIPATNSLIATWNVDTSSVPGNSFTVTLGEIFAIAPGDASGTGTPFSFTNGPITTVALPVPEPTSVAMLAMVGLSALSRRRARHCICN
jgi:hypothetical protein